RPEFALGLKSVVRAVPALEVNPEKLANHPRKLSAINTALLMGRQPLETRAPQDLSQVKGIGGVYEQRLYAAGVGTYWELTNLSDEDLLEILVIENLSLLRTEPEEMRGDALRLAEESNSVGRIWVEERMDDLEPLAGIGERWEQRLYDAGIYTYEDLANATVEQLTDTFRAQTSRHADYAQWIEQARQLVADRSGPSQSAPEQADDMA
ncbi:unnamed protein product, partial [marine sediment metagenome]